MVPPGEGEKKHKHETPPEDGADIFDLGDKFYHEATLVAHRAAASEPAATAGAPILALPDPVLPGPPDSDPEDDSWDDLFEFSDDDLTTDEEDIIDLPDAAEVLEPEEPFYLAPAEAPRPVTAEWEPAAPLPVPAGWEPAPPRPAPPRPAPPRPVTAGWEPAPPPMSAPPRPVTAGWEPTAPLPAPAGWEPTAPLPAPAGWEPTAPRPAAEPILAVETSEQVKDRHLMAVRIKFIFENGFQDAYDYEHKAEFEKLQKLKDLLDAMEAGDSARIVPERTSSSYAFGLDVNAEMLRYYDIADFSICEIIYGHLKNHDQRCIANDSDCVRLLNHSYRDSVVNFTYNERTIQNYNTLLVVSDLSPYEVVRTLRAVADSILPNYDTAEKIEKITKQIIDKIKEELPDFDVALPADVDTWDQFESFLEDLRDRYQREKAPAAAPAGPAKGLWARVRDRLIGADKKIDDTQKQEASEKSKFADVEVVRNEAEVKDLLDNIAQQICEGKVVEQVILNRVAEITGISEDELIYRVVEPLEAYRMQLIQNQVAHEHKPGWKKVFGTMGLGVGLGVAGSFMLGSGLPAFGFLAWRLWDRVVGKKGIIKQIKRANALKANASFGQPRLKEMSVHLTARAKKMQLNKNLIQAAKEGGDKLRVEHKAVVEAIRDEYDQFRDYDGDLPPEKLKQMQAEFALLENEVEDARRIAVMEKRGIVGSITDKVTDNAVWRKLAETAYSFAPKNMPDKSVMIGTSCMVLGLVARSDERLAMIIRPLLLAFGGQAIAKAGVGYARVKFIDKLYNRQISGTDDFYGISISQAKLSDRDWVADHPLEAARLEDQLSKVIEQKVELADHAVEEMRELKIDARKKVNDIKILKALFTALEVMLRTASAKFGYDIGQILNDIIAEAPAPAPAAEAPEPAHVEPTPAPAAEAPEPAHVEPTPAPAAEAPEPAHVEPTPAPAAEAPEPAHVEPTPAPAAEAPEPAHVEPTPAPAAGEVLDWQAVLDQPAIKQALETWHIPKEALSFHDGHFELDPSKIPAADRAYFSGTGGGDWRNERLEFLLDMVKNGDSAGKDPNLLLAYAERAARNVMMGHMSKDDALHEALSKSADFMNAKEVPMVTGAADDYKGVSGLWENVAGSTNEHTAVDASGTSVGSDFEFPGMPDVSVDATAEPGSSGLPTADSLAAAGAGDDLAFPSGPQPGSFGEPAISGGALPGPDDLASHGSDSSLGGEPDDAVVGDAVSIPFDRGGEIINIKDVDSASDLAGIGEVEMRLFDPDNNSVVNTTVDLGGLDNQEAYDTLRALRFFEAIAKMGAAGNLDVDMTNLSQAMDNIINGNYYDRPQLNLSDIFVTESDRAIMEKMEYSQLADSFRQQDFTKLVRLLFIKGR